MIMSWVNQLGKPSGQRLNIKSGKRMKAHGLGLHSRMTISPRHNTGALDTPSINLQCPLSTPPTKTNKLTSRHTPFYE